MVLLWLNLSLYARNKGIVPFLIQNCVHAILNSSVALMHGPPSWYPMFHRIHKAAPFGFAEMLRISGAMSVLILLLLMTR